MEKSTNIHRKRVAIIGISHKGAHVGIGVHPTTLLKMLVPTKFRDVKSQKIHGPDFSNNSISASEKVTKEPNMFDDFFSFFFLSPKLGHISRDPPIPKVVRLNPKVMGGERRGRAGKPKLVEFQVGELPVSGKLLHIPS